MSRQSHPVLIGLLCALAWAPAAALATPGSTLVNDLGCFNCHLGGEGNAALRARLPGLDSLGTRYQAGFLFDYLATPQTRRPAIAPARMPTFPLSDAERVALVDHLKARPAPKTAGPPFPKPGATGVAADGKALVKGALGCIACHRLDGQGGHLAPPLDGAGARLDADWLRRYLIDPSRLAPSTPMPALFYTAGPGGYAPKGPESAAQLASVMAFLGSLKPKQPSKYPAAKAKAAKARTAKAGASLVAGLNCAGCHSDGSPIRTNAPDLTRSGQRALGDWLGRFLAQPVPVRPFGRQPASGGRMPNYRLSEDETKQLLAHLSTTGKALPTPATAMTLSPFKREKARRFMVEKLSCLGCHRLDGKGGRIGPDLSDVALRRPPAYIYNMIHAPQETEPGTVMPKELGRPTPKTLDLVYAYLTERKSAGVKHSYLSPIEAPAIVISNTASAPAKDYAKYCASCHGNDGKGAGFNARFLPTPPTDHTDGKYLSTRPDDTLFDGIHVGGFVLDKSHRMPPWGNTLSRKQIRGLVKHLRTLCQCTEPAWARDNAR